jgi:undecaprenyl-phosphate galactose phosphotransferase/putative colanic acid biosynthesis UDP-glucose lipid carrier transferase
MTKRADIIDRQPAAEVAFGRARVTFPCEAVPYLLSTLDATVISLSSLFGAFFYHWLLDDPVFDPSAYFALGLIASLIHIVRLGGTGYYELEAAAKPTVELVEVLGSWFTTGLLLAFFAFLLKIGDAFSRGSFLVFWAITPIGLLIWRRLAKSLIRRAVSHGTIGRRNIVLLGYRDEMDALRPSDLLGFFGASEVNRFMLSAEADARLRISDDTKTMELIAHFIRQNNATEILLALPWTDQPRIAWLRDQIKILPISAKLLPDRQIRQLTNYASSGYQRIASLEIQSAPLNVSERGVKRAVDIAGASFALLFFMPILLLTALAIKLDGKGPVFFLQNRKGFNGRQFAMFKFRTMTVQENGDVVTQATRNDPRVTKIGRLLRSASIDELPQLLNVLRGEMSLIGPRPHALAHDNQFEKLLQDYAFRHHVKPGMTGWAQVHGLRGATPAVEDIARRVEMDLWYINNWSLWLDVQILFKTVFEVVRDRNAY